MKYKFTINVEIEEKSRYEAQLSLQDYVNEIIGGTDWEDHDITSMEVVTDSVAEGEKVTGDSQGSRCVNGCGSLIMSDYGTMICERCEEPQFKYEG